MLNLIGLFVFNLLATLSYSWKAAYFIWDKSAGAGFLIWLALYQSLPKSFRWMVRPVIVVSFFRFAWNIIAYSTGWNVNSEIWLALFFIVLSAAAGYLTLNKNSSGNKWLSKHLNI